MTEAVLLLSAIPADLRTALAARFTLVEDKQDRQIGMSFYGRWAS